MYLEMQRLAELTEDFESVLMSDGFHAQFCARYLDIKLDPQAALPPLFRKVRTMYDLAEPPLPADKCPDCQTVERLVTWLSPEKT